MRRRGDRRSPDAAPQLPGMGDDVSLDGSTSARELLNGLALRRVRDPLSAEAAAAVVASAWLPGRLEAEVPTAAAEALIDAIGSVRGTDAVVLLLRALAVVAPSRLGARAAAAADRLAATGVREPRWASLLGQATVVGCWRMHHPLGDVENVIVGSRYPDGQEQTLVVSIDHDLGGLVKEAFTAGPPEETLAAYAGAPEDVDVSIDPIWPADAAARIHTALERTDGHQPPIASDDYLVIRPLLDARLATLPAGDPEVDGPEEIGAQEEVGGQEVGEKHGAAFVWRGIPTELHAQIETIVAVCDQACERALDDEYRELSRRLVAQLARKRPSPLRRGDPIIWAAGVLHALGQVNYLFARNAPCHISGKQLAEVVGARPASAAQKATMVRATVGLRPLHPEYTRHELAEMEPLLVRFLYRY